MNGWLHDLASWLFRAFSWLFDGFVDIAKHLLGYVIIVVDECFIYIVGLIPAPTVLTDHSVGAMLGQAGPVIGWLGSAMDLSTAFTIILGGYTFRLTRKLFTIGQW